MHVKFLHASIADTFCSVPAFYTRRTSSMARATPDLSRLLCASSVRALGLSQYHRVGARPNQLYLHLWYALTVNSS